MSLPSEEALPPTNRRWVGVLFLRFSGNLTTKCWVFCQATWGIWASMGMSNVAWWFYKFQSWDDDDDDDDDDDGPHGFLNTVFTVTIPVMSCQSLSIIIWLVVSNLFCFPQYMGQSFPLTNLYFSRWWKPPTSCVWVTRITYHRYRKSVSYHRSMAMMSMATQSWSSMIIAGHWNWQWYTLW